MPHPDPLDVIVVGAGIAGLSAGLSLGRAGHKVKVRIGPILERSDLQNEAGAAIMLCPNAARPLLGCGMDPAGAGFVIAKQSRIAHGATLATVWQRSWDDIVTRFGAPWFFAHRQDLHTELRRMAVAAGVTIETGKRVIDYAADGRGVVLDGGAVRGADVVVAADGVHSRATEIVLGEKKAARATGHSAFRFLIPTARINESPEISQILDDSDGCLKVFFDDSGRRLIQNFVATFPDPDVDEAKDWNRVEDPASLLNEYQRFHPALRAVLREAKSVTKWPLLYRDPIATWHRSNLVIVGDAAHPMLPYQGQAGAQAIEDGFALGIMLGNLTKATAHLVPQRLQLLEKARVNRTSAMQIFSQDVGTRAPDHILEAALPFFDGEIPQDPTEFMLYSFAHDVIKESEALLRREGLLDVASGLP
ncbi:putative salicylate hydroxylase [Macrophomina phaseolina]|uniref:Salicylate hydroxylase n=1 Tax=Macrophomina phaseolina TaxID=35725 RepID=A0ABQ8FU73_9PEZI|nr:putative salicylate hydroxylase [Macrophomina phaseolina]